MSNYIEVSTYEEASHLQIVHNRFAQVPLTEGKIYELLYAKVNDGFEGIDEDFYVVDDQGKQNTGIIAVKTKKLKAI